MKLADVKFLKMKRSDYDGHGHVVTEPIMNFPAWRGWMNGYWGKDLDSIDKICLITGDNRVKFKELFGKCTFTYNGSHYFHCWAVDLGTAQLVVMTAREHGTCYEVVTTRDGVKVQKDIPRVLEFLDLVAELVGKK